MSETMENLSIPIQFTRSGLGHTNRRQIIQIACMSSGDNPRDTEQLLFALVEDVSAPLGASIFVYNRQWLKVPAIDLNCEEVVGLE